MYQRVIPRDLFNEAKFLKSLGQLALFIHDTVDNKQRPTPRSLSIEHNTEIDSGFRIDQNPHDGDLYCSNLNLYVNSRRVDLYYSYNAKSSPYPLLFQDDGGFGITGFVFNDDGSFSSEFLDYVKELEEVGQRIKACGNEKCSVSTGIHDGLTFGSGELDAHGFWSKPCLKCARQAEKRDNVPEGTYWPFNQQNVTDAQYDNNVLEALEEEANQGWLEEDEDLDP